MADACQSLTEVQRQTLKLPDQTSDSPAGNSCRFTSAKFEMLVDVGLSGSTSGLGPIYQRHSMGWWKYWEPTEIDGYPAVAYQDTLDQTKIDCYISVGISESSFMTIRYALADADIKGKNPCIEGRIVASAALSTIKAAR